MNVVVIITDSLRADHTGYMKFAGKAQTPNLDAFAAEGTVFEHYYPEGLPTLPVRTAWWTGHRAWHSVRLFQMAFLHPHGLTAKNPPTRLAVR